MSDLDPDRVWDRWEEQRRGQPELTPRAFALGFPGRESQIQASIELMLSVSTGLSPLVPELFAADGEVFAGHRILRELGAGAFGRVFEAEHLGRGGRVALKILNPLIAAPGVGREILQREARIARVLDHPGIVRCLESGVHRGYAWISSELCQGVPLSEVVEQGRPAPERHRLAASIALQVARALEHAHGQGVVHRDLKPANLLIDAGGVVRIVDFGLAHARTPAMALSVTGDRIGTPIYMSPEQARGAADLGPATDLYSLGLVMVEVASGSKLTAPEQALAALLKIARGRHGLPRGAVRALTPGLRHVIRRCTETHPADRYASAGELCEDLEDLLSGRKPRSRRPSAARRAWRRARRHPRGATLVGLCAATVLWASWSAWWNAPVDVRIDSLLSGKLLYLDGVERGVLPVTVRLRPGEYRYELAYGGLGSGAPRYSGTIDVPHRRPGFVFKTLDYWDSTPRLLAPSASAENGAWVHLSTPLEVISLDLDGERVADGAPGIVLVRVPFGSHRLAVHGEGFRSRAVDLQIDNQEMRMVALELDPEHSEWRTLIAYSPLDTCVQESIAELKGLRVFSEYMRQSATQMAMVHKLYYGPTRSRGGGTLLFSLPLPGDFEEIRLDVVNGAGGRSPDPWVRVEMGPSPERMMDVAGFAGSPVVRARRGLAEQNPTPELLARLAALLRGAERVFVRYTLGDGAAGEGFSYACALRAEGIALRTSGGELVWEPALRIQVR